MPKQGLADPGFAARLRAHRLRLGLSQHRLAVDSGLHPSTVRKLEAGRSMPEWNTVRRLAARLGIRPQDFVFVND